MTLDELEKKFLLNQMGDKSPQRLFDDFQSGNLVKLAEQHERLNEKLKNPPMSFGPFFAERVMNYVKNMKNQIDYQIIWFFKKYQLIAVGLLVALISLNIFLSNEITIQSMLGMEVSPQENFQSTDLYELLSEALNQ